MSVTIFATNPPATVARTANGVMLAPMRASSNPVTRFRRLGPRRRQLLVEASVTLALAAFAVEFRPFRKAIRTGCTPLGDVRSGTVEECVWAVEAAGRRVPWRNVCIQKGIALQRMLRRRGYDAVLHYGARNSSSERALEAHVWVTLDGQTLIGGAEADQFAELATYP